MLLNNTILYYKIQYYKICYYTILNNIIQYTNIQYDIIHCNTIQYYIIQYYTIPYNTISALNHIFFPYRTSLRDCSSSTTGTKTLHKTQKQWIFQEIKAGGKHTNDTIQHYTIQYIQYNT